MLSQFPNVLKSELACVQILALSEIWAFGFLTFTVSIKNYISKLLNEFCLKMENFWLYPFVCVRVRYLTVIFFFCFADGSSNGGNVQRQIRLVARAQKQQGCPQSIQNYPQIPVRFWTSIVFLYCVFSIRFFQQCFALESHS